VFIRLHGVSEMRFEDEAEDKPHSFSFFPDHLYTELIIGLSLLIILTTLAVAVPAHLGPPADPLSTPEIIKPEWFFYVAFRWLKLFSGTAAVISMGAVVVTMFAWPWIDGAIRKRNPNSELSVYFGILAVLAIIGLTVWEAVVAH
jgi:ubiquinol-cytochrome c reductase cytochrome b subunit/cytochrome b6